MGLSLIVHQTQLHPKGKNLVYHHKTIQLQHQKGSELMSGVRRANELKISLTNITEWITENSALIVISTDIFNFSHFKEISLWYKVKVLYL